MSAMNVDEVVDARKPAGVTDEDAKVELERLLSDAQFHSTERNRNFLKYVANAVFEGNSASVKAYTIAVDVFGRPSSFDPSTDPIVRIEATRLRASLVQYYEARTDIGSVHIELPRGRYIPVFSRIAELASGASQAEDAAVKEYAPHVVKPAKVVSLRNLLLLGLPIAAGCLGLWAFLARGPIYSDKPNVAIEMKLAGDPSDGEAVFIRDYLMIALSQFHTLKLSAPDQPQALGRDVSRQTADVTFLTSDRRMSRYHVKLKYHSTASERAVWWQVVNPATGEALRSGVEKILVGNKTNEDLRRELVTNLANRFAGARGVINSTELTRELAAPTIGNGCILRAAVAIEQHNGNEMWEARTCLESTLSVAPNDADVNAQLAVLLLESTAPDIANDSTERALLLANKSVSLAPMSELSNYAQMLAQFRNGQTEAAFVSGYRAMALNPQNSAIPARLGAMLFAAGRWAEGSGLAIKAGLIDDVPHSDAGLTLALDAYRRGEFAEALLRVQQMGRSDDYVANILELAAAAQVGDTATVGEVVTRLKSRDRQFWTTFRAEMAARQYAPVLIDNLGAGLMKAGLALPQWPQGGALDATSPLVSSTN